MVDGLVWPRYHTQWIRGSMRSEKDGTRHLMDYRTRSIEVVLEKLLSDDLPQLSWKLEGSKSIEIR